MISDPAWLWKALFSLAISLIFAAGIKYLLKVKSEMALVAIVGLFSILLIFRTTGPVESFKIGDSGLEAKFATVANMAIVPSSIIPLSGSAKEIQEISDAKAVLGIGAQVVILQQLRENATLSSNDVISVAHKISPGLLQGNFEVLVVIDRNMKVVGYFSREFFFDLLRIELEQTIRGERKSVRPVKEQIEQTQLWDIVENPKMRAEDWGSKVFIKYNASNVDALGQLDSSNQEVGVVVAEDQTYAGIVRRSNIMAKMLIGLSSLNSSLPPK